MQAVYYEPRSRHPELPYERGTPLPLMQEALRRAGCELSVISAPSPVQGQLPACSERLRQAEQLLAEDLLSDLRSDPARQPDVWVTGAICPHKPDWVGPLVSRELRIPYVLVEPQIGAGTSEFATAEEKQAAKQAVRQAAAIITTRSETAQGLSPLLDDPGRLVRLLPFLDLAPSLSASHLRATCRNGLACRLGTSATAPCLMTDGPQQVGLALDAWRMLALALSRIVMLDWQLLVLGRGDAQREVREALCRLPQHRVHYWAEAAPEDRFRALAGSDLYVWPGTGEGDLASLLEAQAAGTPVVACRSPDVADRVLDGQTGRLAAANAESLANAISFLLRQPVFLETYAKQAREIAVNQHDLRAAAWALRGILATMIPRPGGETQG